MSKAYIFNEHLSHDDCIAVEACLRDAGFDPLYGVIDDISLIDPDVDIGVVGLPVALEDVAAVNVRIDAFAHAGIRVVGIWLHGKEDMGAGIPEGLGKYGTTVDIGSPKLTSTLKGEVDVWEEPGGAPCPTPKTKRNNC